MKILVVSPRSKSIVNFRGDLIKAMVARGHEVAAIGPELDYLEEIERLGARFIHLPMEKNSIGIWHDIKYYDNLKNIIRSERPDRVFSFTIKPVIYGSYAAQKVGVEGIYPMVAGLGRLYSTDSFMTNIIRSISGVLYKKAFQGCNRVIFQNEDDLRQFVGLGYVTPQQAVKVNGSGVNMERFTPNAMPGNQVFLMVAKLILDKGPLIFIEAAAIVKKKYPEARFIILGGYDYSIRSIREEDLKPYVDAGIVEIPGEVRDVVPFLRECDYFVLPTFYREGIPRSILEAMAMARPVITTDSPGCREAVQDGINGLLVKPRDSVDLAEKMEYMLENQDQARAMGANGLAICRERYDVHKVNQHMLSIMEIE